MLTHGHDATPLKSQTWFIALIHDGAFIYAVRRTACFLLPTIPSLEDCEQRFILLTTALRSGLHRGSICPSLSVSNFTKARRDKTSHAAAANAGAGGPCLLRYGQGGGGIRTAAEDVRHGT